VWHEFSPLAVQYGAVNLGQGFPDWDPPAFVCEAMIQSVLPQYQRHANQYARSYAHMPLARVLAKQYTERWKKQSCLRDHDINPVTEVATAVGCTNALYCALQGLLSSGDEVILLEPAFDIVRVVRQSTCLCPFWWLRIGRLTAHLIVFVYPTLA
jgi:kynurenine--oxoglutarate transaminase/cysteine-S-conjugate beta-lyase/glutamine--phenylpyruvate transaminase